MDELDIMINISICILHIHNVYAHNVAVMFMLKTEQYFKRLFIFK